MNAYTEEGAERTEWSSGSAQFTADESLQSLATCSDFATLSAAVPTLSQDRRRTLLDHVVATRILPRLVAARRATTTGRAAPGAAVTTKDDTDELVRLLLIEDVPRDATNSGLLGLPEPNAQPADCLAFIALLRRRGATPESLYLGILTDAARCLGELWNTDRCDFLQVTIGLGRLQQLARALATSFLSASVNLADAPSLLLVPARGEQHTFGLLILTEFFRRAGWRVAGGPASLQLDPAAMARDTWFDVAGFSIGSESLISGLIRSIRDVRRASRNRDVRVMVGGPLFLQRPDLVMRVGADTAAADAPSAVRQATSLLVMSTAAVSP